MGERAGDSAVDIGTGKRSICMENTDSAPLLEQDSMVAWSADRCISFYVRWLSGMSQRLVKKSSL